MTMLARHAADPCLSETTFRTDVTTSPVGVWEYQGDDALFTRRFSTLVQRVERNGMPSALLLAPFSALDDKNIALDIEKTVGPLVERWLREGLVRNGELLLNHRIPIIILQHWLPDAPFLLEELTCIDRPGLWGGRKGLDILFSNRDTYLDDVDLGLRFGLEASGLRETYLHALRSCLSEPSSFK